MLVVISKQITLFTMILSIGVIGSFHYDEIYAKVDPYSLSEIKCSNSQHVLTERPNGKLACVTERTAEKTGWIVINTAVSFIDEYNATDDSEEILVHSSSTSMMGEGLEISIESDGELPALGENMTISITAKNTQDITIPADRVFYAFGLFSDNLELVNYTGMDSGTEQSFHPQIHGKLDYEIKPNQVVTITATIKATSTGYASMISVLDYHEFNLDFVVTSDEGLSLEEYDKLADSDRFETKMSTASEQTEESNHVKTPEEIEHLSLVKIPLGAVVEGNTMLIPETITVVLGINNTVTWINQDDALHGITSDRVEDGWGSLGVIKPGDSYAHVFENPGIFSYHGEPHPWMTGTVIVLEQ